MNAKTRCRNRGLTLAESLLASVVLVTCVISIFTALNAGQVQSSDSAQARLAVNLVDEMMERVLGLPYNDPNGVATPGPEAGESNFLLYDNMDDYIGYSEAAGQLKGADGNLLPGNYQVFSRKVTGQYTTQTVAGLAASVSGLQMTVTVTDSKGRTWTANRFVAAAAHPPPN